MGRKILFTLAISLIISFVVFSYCALATEGSEDAGQPKIGYILISSKELSHVNAVLRKSIKTLFANARETYLEHNCAQAKKYIKELDIKFVPFVIYDDSIATTNRFSHMTRHKMVDKVKGYYVIPDEQLRMGEIMLLGREKTILRPAVPIEFFYSENCPPCVRIKEDFLPKLKARYKDKIVINYHDISETDALELKLTLEKEYGILKGSVPEVFLPTVALEGGNAIRKGMADAIEGILAQKGPGAAEKIIPEGSPILDKFFTFGPAIIAFAGLVDGVNPCAFAAMVFFVSFLAINNYGKKQIAYLGGAFILSVFLTYLALGLGIFHVFRKLQIFSFASQLIYYAIAFLALGLGIYSLRDYITYKRTGQTKGCSLRWYNRLRSLADNRRGLIILVIAAFINGFIIALLESACTGQIYFPTIAFVMKVPSLRLHAFLYLVLYNSLFIVPLVAIFLLACKGTSSEKFALFQKRHLGGIKLTYALLFFGLAILLFVLV